MIPLMKEIVGSEASHAWQEDGVHMAEAVKICLFQHIT